MNPSPNNSNPGFLGLSRWAVGYAARRRLALGSVLITVLLRVGLDLLKPWPMVFLVDYVLSGRTTPLTLRIAQALPGAPDVDSLIL